MLTAWFISGDGELCHSLDHMDHLLRAGGTSDLLLSTGGAAAAAAVDGVRIVVDDIIVALSIKTKANVDNDNNNTSSAKVCCQYHLVVGEDNGIAIPDTTGIVFCNLKLNDHDDHDEDRATVQCR
jgi:hypothetical protein